MVPDRPGSVPSLGMGGADCELLGDGWLAQPVNAWSSLAYLVAAAWVVRRRRGAVPLLGAVALALVAVGSFAYHGPQPGWGEAAHDASIAALLVVLLLHAGGPPQRRFAAGALIVAVGCVLVAPASDALVHGTLAVAVTVVELRRRRQRRGPATAADRMAVAALAVGVALFLLGRTGGPLCAPSSVVQPHAGWHVATAVAAAAALVSPHSRRGG